MKKLYVVTEAEPSAYLQLTGEPVHAFGDAAVVIEVRCETCRHWDFAGGSLPRGFGVCDAIAYNLAGVVSLAGHGAEHTDYWTQRDFGCALWESKQ